MPKNKQQKPSIAQLRRMFPDDEAAEAWFIAQRWPGGVVHCAYCNSHRVTERTKIMSKRVWRCDFCHKGFTTKTGTFMESSNLGYRVWAMAIFLMTKNIKTVAIKKFANELGISQQSARKISEQIHGAILEQADKTGGIVRIDEKHIGEGKGAEKRPSRRSKAEKQTTLELKKRAA